MDKEELLSWSFGGTYDTKVRDGWSSPKKKRSVERGRNFEGLPGRCRAAGKKARGGGVRGAGFQTLNFLRGGRRRERDRRSPASLERWEEAGSGW